MPCKKTETDYWPVQEDVGVERKRLVAEEAWLEEVGLVVATLATGVVQYRCRQRGGHCYPKRPQQIKFVQ